MAYEGYLSIQAKLFRNSSQGGQHLKAAKRNTARDFFNHTFLMESGNQSMQGMSSEG